MSKADTRKIVDAISASIAEAAANDDNVSLSGFGKFKIKARAAREGRTPATGVTTTIAASKKLGFWAAKAIKDRLTP